MTAAGNMQFGSLKELRREAKRLRRRLEMSFTPETALANNNSVVASAGQCAAVAVIVFNKFGGLFVSASIDGSSHWFNRVRVGATLVDVDLTGDQFGRPSVQIGVAGSLYMGERLRDFNDLKRETLARANKLAMKAGLAECPQSLDRTDPDHVHRG